MGYGVNINHLISFNEIGNKFEQVSDRIYDHLINESAVSISVPRHN
jgi:hypothetical protein